MVYHSTSMGNCELGLDLRVLFYLVGKYGFGFFHTR